MSYGVETAFVLGAGLGTRLMPLTSERPKPLVPVYGKPLITFALDHLIAAGVQRFVINTHHKPEAYTRLLGMQEGRAVYHGKEILFSHEDVLMETGGGILQARELIGDEPFLVHNGDVLADLDLQSLIENHRANDNLATLGLRSFGGPLHVNYEADSGLVRDIRGKLGFGHLPAFLFTGVYVLSPEIFDFIPPGEIVSITPILLERIRQGSRVGGVVLDEGTWFDLGTIASYLEVHRLFASPSSELSYLSHTEWPEMQSPSALVDPTAILKGFHSLADRSQIGAGSLVEDCVLWEGASVGEGLHLRDCVLRENQHADRDAEGIAF